MKHVGSQLCVAFLSVLCSLSSSCLSVSGSVDLGFSSFRFPKVSSRAGDHRNGVQRCAVRFLNACVCVYCIVFGQNRKEIKQFDLEC